MSDEPDYRLWDTLTANEKRERARMYSDAAFDSDVSPLWAMMESGEVQRASSGPPETKNIIVIDGLMCVRDESSQCLHDADSACLTCWIPSHMQPHGIPMSQGTVELMEWGKRKEGASRLAKCPYCGVLLDKHTRPPNGRTCYFVPMWTCENHAPGLEVDVPIGEACSVCGEDKGMSDKELEERLKRIARDCNPKVKNGWVRLEGEVTNAAQMQQMDAAMRLIEARKEK